MTCRIHVRSLWTVGAANPVLFFHSTPVSTTVTIPEVDVCALTIVIGVMLSPIVTSTASTPPSSASAISTSLPALYYSSGAVDLRSSAVLFAPFVGPVVGAFCPAGSYLLLPRSSLVVFSIFAHLLLNAMWFPLQSGHFSCVWPQREPCCAIHPTTLYLWKLVQYGPEQ